MIVLAADPTPCAEHLRELAAALSALVASLGVAAVWVADDDAPDEPAP